MSITVRPCTPADEEAWLRCRVLSFLHSAYLDDVRTAHSVPAPGLRPEDSLQWVAEDEAGTTVGVLDLEAGAAGTAEENLATIDTVAVHPDHRGRGIAGSLLAALLPHLPARVTTLDAWTRDDAAAHAWYRAEGFAVDQVYLHVYADDALDDAAALEGFTTPEGLSVPVKAFLHARLEDETALRRRFRRVHRCHRFVREVAR